MVDFEIIPQWIGLPRPEVIKTSTTNYGVATGLIQGSIPQFHALLTHPWHPDIYVEMFFNMRRVFADGIRLR